MPLSFRQLEAFRAVMITGSASRAAELLEVTQPAVSRAIADLERDVGFALFERVRSRLVPTPEGQLFFVDVGASFAELDRLRSAAARIREFGFGTIRVACLSVLGHNLVPLAIRRFREKHPGATVRLHLTSSEQVRGLVASGQFVVGIAAEGVDLQGVDYRAYASFRAMCVMPPGHPLAQKSVIQPADLHGLPFVTLAPEDGTRVRMEKAFELAGVRPEVVVETQTSAAVCGLALEGVGVGLVIPVALDGFLERGLVARPFEPAIYFNSWLLFRPDTQQAVLTKAFVAELLRARSRKGSPTAVHGNRFITS